MSELLIDITRLVWRTWRGRHPTGIDRVCLAYVEHFGERALAVIQRRGLCVVLSRVESQKLFALFLRGREASRVTLAWMLAKATLTARASPPRNGMLYLNVGHTGLNDRSLSDWIARHQLLAVHLIHDLIPVTHPEYCRPGEAERHALRMEHALASAAGIIGNSKATLDELRAFARDRGFAMPPSIAALISGYEGRELPRSATCAKPYFVVVGTIEGRKNHLSLLKVWQRLVRRWGVETPVLVIAGQRGWEADEAINIIDRPGALRGFVHEISDCNDAQLAGWIAGARALLMPSFAEGFGLPITEALSMGTPVIASDLPVFHEIAGDIPKYLDPRDLDAWEGAITSFVNDGPARLRQLEKIGGYLAPTWADHFQSLEPWLEELQARPSFAPLRPNSA